MFMTTLLTEDGFVECKWKNESVRIEIPAELRSDTVAVRRFHREVATEMAKTFGLTNPTIAGYNFNPLGTEVIWMVYYQTQ